MVKRIGFSLPSVLHLEGNHVPYQALCRTNMPVSFNNLHTTVHFLDQEAVDGSVLLASSNKKSPYRRSTKTISLLMLNWLQTYIRFTPLRWKQPSTTFSLTSINSSQWDHGLNHWVQVLLNTTSWKLGVRTEDKHTVLLLTWFAVFWNINMTTVVVTLWPHPCFL